MRLTFVGNAIPLTRHQGRATSCAAVRTTTRSSRPPVDAVQPVGRRRALHRLRMQHGKFPVGARVRVIKSVIMYHTPMKRNEEYDVKGLEGVVIKYADEYEGMPVSANRPIQVQLEGSKKFTAHFEANELEHVE